jgi:electron transfer flavoprotein alpha subunit
MDTKHRLAIRWTNQYQDAYMKPRLLPTLRKWPPAVGVGAASSASRAVTDAFYCANGTQIGQTSKITAPELYMAIGTSHAVQHPTGIEDAGTIVAINTDGEAPIFEITDYRLVRDLLKIIPELEQVPVG